MCSYDGVSARVLAGGSSRRMGKPNKLLTNMNGSPMASHVVKIASSSSAKETIVVTGYQSELLRNALSQ